MAKILETYYVITAMEKGERVYQAIDNHSGGYPYWSSYLSSANKHSIVPVINFKGDKYHWDTVQDPVVWAIDVVVREEYTPDMSEQAAKREKLLRLQAEMEKIQAEYDKVNNGDV